MIDFKRLRETVGVSDGHYDRLKEVSERAGLTNLSYQEGMKQTEERKLKTQERVRQVNKDKEVKREYYDKVRKEIMNKPTKSWTKVFEPAPRVKAPDLTLNADQTISGTSKLGNLGINPLFIGVVAIAAFFIFKKK